MKRIVIILVLVFTTIAHGSLAFTSDADSHVNVGSGTSIDDLAAFTIVAWIYPTSLVSDDRGFIWTKGSGAAGAGLQFGINHDGNHVAGSLHLGQLGTPDLDAFSTAAEVTVNTWCFVAATGSIGVTMPKMYEGTLTTTVTEITGGYDGQATGANIDSDAALNGYVGNWSATNMSFPGYVDVVVVWNRILSLGELKDQQFRPHKTSGCVGLWYPGFHGIAAMPDLSGNGNDGAVFTNVSLAQGVPLGPPFGFSASVALLGCVLLLIRGRNGK